MMLEMLYSFIGSYFQGIELEKSREYGDIDAHRKMQNRYIYAEELISLQRNESTSPNICSSTCAAG